ncbi:hypothetical protein [Pseudothauera rhizosphaerae]|uniref:Large polyvalent protein associated domain-containing protein n=1 Tax=Pseudothauera rhizosphaerae TaxID=2565932 RepID=A0A4S4AWA1_9RHOO|nr:hypothetical protein [Pseudothauera rhizosphaerae]THF64312.1 hypothetical protein E6O51_03095 [Pseudothauera rhizosphaerae]
MPDIYDTLLDQQADATEPAAPPTLDIYDQILDRERDDAQRAVQSTLDRALKIAPQRAATVQQLAERTGLPADLVERNFEDIERRDRVREVQRLAASSPILARQLFDPQFAALAHQDVEQLGIAERIARQLAGGALEAPGRTISGTGHLLDVAQRNTLGGLAAMVLPTPRAGGAPTAESLVGPLMGEGWRQAGSGLKDYARNELMLPAAQRTFFDDVMAGLGQVGAQIAMLPFDRGAGLYAQGADVMAERVAGDQAGQGLKDLAILGGAAVTGITERWALDRIMGPLAVPVKNKMAAALARIGIAGVSEGAQEMAENILHDTLRIGLTNPEHTYDWQETGYEGAVGATVGALARSFVEAALHVRTRGARREQQAQQAEGTAQQLAQLGDLARAMSMTQHSPDTFQQFLDAALEDGPVQDVLVSGQVLMQSGIAEDLARISPSVAAQLQEAVQTGGDVRIPVSEFAAKIAPAGLDAALLDHLKTDTNPMSRAEAGEYLQRQVEELGRDVGDALTQVEAQVEERMAIDDVRDAVLTELNAANRFRPDVNTAYATLVGEFFGALSSRTGLAPQQLFEKYRLRVVAESVAGGQQFEQSDDNAPRTTEELLALFRDLEADSIEITAPGIRPMTEEEADHAESVFLSSRPAGETTYSRKSGVLRRIRRASEAAADELRGEAETAREVADSALGPFEGYRVEADIIPPGEFRPGGIKVRVYGREQIDAGLTNDPALTFLVSADGELTVNGPPEDSETFREFQQRGWADTASAADGVQVHGWTVLRDPANPDKPLPVSQLMPLLADVHARVREWRGEDMVGLHWSRATGAMGGTYDLGHAFNGAAVFFQGAGAARGGLNPETLTMALLKGADLSTFLHESGHFFLEVMADVAATARSYDTAQMTDGERAIINDVGVLMQWFGLPDLDTWHALPFDEKRAYHEKFAESFERYLLEGQAPSIELQPLFSRFRAWMLSVYRSLKDFLARNSAAGKLSPEVRQVFDRMLATDDAIRTAEQAGSLRPLFDAAESAGMDAEAFADYQALGQQATDVAQSDLSARGVRDMQWLAGARSRALRRLQKEAKVLRDEMEIETRREVMSQPVYQAWQFLTRQVEATDTLPVVERRKSDPDTVDPTVDSLFTAIAKLGGLDRAQLESEWGLDAKEKAAPPLFGKHVLRRNGGRGIDEMRGLLVQYGYLTPERAGADFDPREFEDLFFEELGGAPVYSTNADYDYLAQLRQRPGDQVANPAALLAGRLDRAALANTSASPEQLEVLRARRMTARDGLHPDIVAELTGFDSGDALVQALVAAHPPEVEIEALTDLRMLERHGDLATPEALERAADRAVHNDVRARMVATELSALARATGQRAVMTQAAREYARQMVARLKVRHVKPTQYSRAAARASTAAEAALRAGNRELAAVEKRNQLIGLQATRAAHQALGEVESGLQYLAKFNSEGTRKSVDPDYLEQIDSMLERFDLRAGQSLKAIDKRTSLAKWIAAQEEAGIEPDIPDWIQVEAAREHYKNLTVEQFRGLVDSVKQIEHLGRLKHKLLTARDKRALDAIVAEVRDSITAAAGGRVVGNERRNTLGSRAEHMARGFMAAHRKLASLVREMDGMQDGGALWEYLVRPMNEAGEREATMRAEAAQRLHDLAKPLLADGERMGGTGRHFPSLGRALNRGERIALALNWGNAGNRQRLLDGRGWTRAQVMPVLQTLTPAEWQFVQGVWDFFEGYRPQIAAKERRVAGKEPEWIEAEPFTVTPANGAPIALRGGYYPVKYDPAQSGEAAAHADAESAKQMMRAAYTAATTRRSFTKSRSERVVGRPLLLSFDGIYQGANEVIHDLAWHEWLIDANKLLRRLDASMRQGFGAEKVTAIKKAIEDIARGDAPAQHMVERALNHLRTGATITGLGWNLTTALLQPLGFTNSMVRIGPAWVARGMREFYGSPSRMLEKAEEAQAKSEFLRNRARTMNREINDVQNRLEGDKGDIRLALEASYFILIQKLQAAVDYPTWYGAYEKAMADPANLREGGTADEVRAVAMADQAVIDAQGGGQIKDLAQVQRGSAAWKLFTNFYSYFSVTLNLAAERTRATNFRRPHDVMRLAGDYLLLFTVPAVLGSLLRDALKGEDDEDELVQNMAAEQISFLMGLFVGVRELTGAAQALAGVGKPFGYSGPAGARFFGEMQKLSQQIDQGELDMALFKAANNTAGILFHYPAGQVNRTVEGAAAMLEGRTANPLSVVVGPPR